MDKCPKCNSENLSYDSFESDGEFAWQKITCEDCAFQMNNVFEHSHYEDADTLEKI